MKVNHEWLRQWVDTDLAPASIAEKLTLAGLEVDECVPLGAALDGVVVGEIVDLKPHPDADRLRVCRVAGDAEERTVVCGAPNARLGLKAPLATLGSVLPGGMKIKPARLRGVASEGMLCSEPELGLGDEAGGLMELPADAPTGTALSEYLGLDDHVLDIDLTPNRADCLSIRGLARELSALTGVALTEPEITPLAPVVDDRVDISLAAAEDCPRYLGRVIRNVDVHASTPLWMVERLRRCGVRSLGPIVDVTNYVLLELGQPMHAFDLATLNGGIHVRRAREGERMVLLDEREVELDADMLLICDQQRPLAIGGIIGGLDSAVGERTQDILLESAWFNPASIIGRGRRLGLATESSHRFERGVDPSLQHTAMERASELIVSIAGGQPGPVVEQAAAGYLPQPVEVTLRTERVNRLLGTDLGDEEILGLLRRLGMAVRGNQSPYQVAPPSARRDIESEVDLIEEVARMQGYDRLPARAPGGHLRLTMAPEAEIPEARLRRQLAARGFQEIITWSFVSEQDLQRLDLDDGAQALANPLNREMAVLRTSLLPGLLKTAAANFRRQQDNIRLFELGACFCNRKDGFNEPQRLSLLMSGRVAGEHASGPARKIDFFDLKGELEHLVQLNGVGESLRYQRSTASWLHPGQGADVLSGDKHIGSIGQLHPTLANELDAAGPVFVAELDAGPLRQSHLPQHQRGSRFPSVRRDLALVVDEHTPAGDLINELREIGGVLLEDCVVFDEYRGKGIETGCKSLALGLILRDVSRTLVEEEVEQLTSRMIEGLGRRFGARLRG